MSLDEIRKDWTTLGAAAPLWAVCVDPAKRHGGWDDDEFLASGRAEIDAAMARLAELGIAHGRERALDFGCGVGRLTQALCAYFEQCCGVDIAPSMIELARGHNGYGSRCRYEVNAAPDLRLFADGSFDFIYSSLVLQHMRRRYAKGYITEFLRILSPGGCLVFRLPSELRQPLTRVRRLVGSLYWLGKDCLAAFGKHISPRMEMHGIPQAEVVELVTHNGGEVRAVCDDLSAGPAWISSLYIVTKPGTA